VLTEDALELGREGRQGGARALVEGVGLELDAQTPETLEGVFQHQQLRLDVRSGLPEGGR
jgi:hypothetical protein